MLGWGSGMSTGNSLLPSCTYFMSGCPSLWPGRQPQNGSPLPSLCFPREEKLTCPSSALNRENAWTGVMESSQQLPRADCVPSITTVSRVTTSGDTRITILLMQRLRPKRVEQFPEVTQPARSRTPMPEHPEGRGPHSCAFQSVDGLSQVVICCFVGKRELQELLHIMS